MANLLERFNVTDEQLKKYEKYHELLSEKNKVMNLTAITDYEGVFIKHFYDSLLLTEITKDFDNLVDIGSGAGFPGMVLGIKDETKRITLLEPTTKRCKFLETVKNELNLDNISVINDRAENVINKKFKYATARAVAQINILLELVIPLLEVHGLFFCLKGTNYQEELEKAEHAINELNIEIKNIYHFELPNDLGKRVIIVFEKKKQTNPKYPRPYASILKKPL